MMPMSSTAPPIAIRTLTFFACAAGTSWRVPSSEPPPSVQFVAPCMVPNARFRCVILLKSIFVAQLPKLPFQFGRYITTFVSGICVLGAPPMPPLAPPLLAPALDPPPVLAPAVPPVLAGAPPVLVGAPPAPALWLELPPLLAPAPPGCPPLFELLPAVA